MTHLITPPLFSFFAHFELISLLVLAIIQLEKGGFSVKTTPLWQTIISYIIPLISIFLSYLLGHIQAIKNNKISVKREKYDNFYSPYASKIYAGMMWEINYSNLSTESKSIFFDMIMKNIHYLDEETVKLVPNFYLCFINALEYTNDIKVQKELDKNFNNITMKILSQTSKLSKELNLTDFANFALKMYAQSNQEK